MEKLSELSKPVQIFKHPSGRNFWSVSADSNAGQQDVEAFYSQEYVSALLAELEDERASRARWKLNSRRAEERAEEAEKRVALIREQRDNEMRTNSELKKRLATPVQLQNCDFESVAIMAHWCTDEQLKAWVKGVEHAKKQIRAAGFKVKGDE